MKTRLALAIAGLAFLGIGAYALLSTLDTAAMPSFVTWMIGVVVVHDLLLAPVTIAVGFVLTRYIPARVRPIVQGGVIVAAVVTLFSIPTVLALGRYPENPSLLPLDYGRNLVIILITIAAVTGLLVVIRLLRTRTDDVASPSS